MNFVNLSHVDLDGYSSAFVLKTFIKNNTQLSEVETYTTFHADYKDITEKLVEITNEGLDNIYLLISDLNLNVDNAKVLVDNQHLFNTVVLIDHHVTNQETLEYLKNRSFEFIEFIDHKWSATLLSYKFCEDFYKKHDLQLSDHNNIILKYATLVDKYDTYKRSEIEEFRKAKLINSVFSEWSRKMSNNLGNEDFVNFNYPNIIISAIISIIIKYFYNGQKNQFDFMVFESDLNNSINGFLTQRLHDTLETPLNEKDTFSSMELIARTCSSVFLDNMKNEDKFFKTNYSVKLDIKDVRVVISAVPLDREMVYSCLYDTHSVDIFVMFNSKRSAFELRGSTDTVVPSRISLAYLAKEFGGGGHPAAAGFPASTNFPSVDYTKQSLDFFKNAVVDVISKKLYDMIY